MCLKAFTAPSDPTTPIHRPAISKTSGNSSHGSGLMAESTLCPGMKATYHTATQSSWRLTRSLCWSMLQSLVRFLSPDLRLLAGTTQRRIVVLNYLVRLLSLFRPLASYTISDMDCWTRMLSETVPLTWTNTRDYSALRGYPQRQDPIHHFMRVTDQCHREDVRWSSMGRHVTSWCSAEDSSVSPLL